MAQNTAPQVDNELFPLGKPVSFWYDSGKGEGSKERFGIVHKTTDENLTLQYPADHDGPPYGSFNLLEIEVSPELNQVHNNNRFLEG
tara:strand:- start:380 stop:640 length:261 start_codon:yes stop_codon:yes gene_type:complete